ncbi:hypothetical protein [Mediterranea massiliensis]|uniref:hypothetical protein n=1 Tax=Mediterranea massiliensis TaxID=1841865 RepID=UPI0032079AFB
MSDTTVNLTPEVVETIYDLQTQEYASLHVDTLQRVLTGIIRNDMGSDEERLKLAGEVLYLQDTMRCFILNEKGGAQ